MRILISEEAGFIESIIAQWFREDFCNQVVVLDSLGEEDQSSISYL